MPRHYQGGTHIRDSYHGINPELVKVIARRSNLGLQNRSGILVSRFGLLLVAIVIGVPFFLFLQNGDRGDPFHANFAHGVRDVEHGAASMTQEGISRNESGDDSLRKAYIDPNFAKYLHSIAKREAEAVTGRKFLSVNEDFATNDPGADDLVSYNPVDAQEISEAITSGVSASKTKKSNKKRLSSNVVQLPSLIRDGYNITRVSQMLLRMIMTYSVHSMVVIPCGKHAEWIGTFLEGTGRKRPKPFVFYCVDSSKRELYEAENVIGEADGVNANFIDRQFWKTPLPRADMIFSWEGLDDLSVLHTHKLLENVIKQGHHKFVFLASTPSTERNSDRSPLNLRRSPFSYARPQKIFKELYLKESAKASDRQLYFYEVSKMKKSGKL